MLEISCFHDINCTMDASMHKGLKVLRDKYACWTKNRRDKHACGNMCIWMRFTYRPLYLQTKFHKMGAAVGNYLHPKLGMQNLGVTFVRSLGGPNGEVDALSKAKCLGLNAVEFLEWSPNLVWHVLWVLLTWMQLNFCFVFSNLVVYCAHLLYTSILHIILISRIGQKLCQCRS